MKKFRSNLMSSNIRVKDLDALEQYYNSLPKGPEAIFGKETIIIGKKNPKLEMKDGRIIQQVRPKHRSGTKKSKTAEKVKRQEARMVSQLNKKDKVKYKLMCELDNCVKFKVIGPKYKERLLRAFVRRDYNAFESLVQLAVMTNSFMKLSQQELKSRTNRLAGLISLFENAF